MASLLLLLVILFFTIPTSQQLTLPLTKHTQTGHYLTRLNHTQTRSISLLLDLSSPFIWIHCGPHHNPTPLPCRSILCSSTRFHLPCPTSPSTSPCSLLLVNPLTGSHSTGHLVDHHDSSSSLPFACSPSSLLHGLPRGASGVFGLGGQSQTLMSHSIQYSQIFNLCLPPSSGVGVLKFGGISEVITDSLMYTPLLPGSDYVVNLKSIRIGNKRIVAHGQSSTMKISTISPFSRMESGIYDPFVNGFVMAAESLNMSRVVANVGPFEACYNMTGRNVPVVDLVLQSEMVTWRIYEHNLMVKVNEDVKCLGFLNGGLDLEASVVLGGYQLEDNLLEFDLSSSMLGFSSSLIAKQHMTCSRLGELAKSSDVQYL